MDYFLGQIILVPYGFVPAGFLPCDGSLLDIQKNAALYSLIGPKFGGDGHSTFALPKLAGKEPDPALRYVICQNGIYPERP